MTNKLPTSMEFILGTNVTATSTGVANYPREPEETFEQWLKRNVREFPVTLDLTSDVLAWVSRIVTYWAVAEWIQLGTLARLLAIERKEGRVMFGSRIGNATVKIRQLIDMKDIKTSVNLEALSTTLNECEKARNLVGHGVWMIDPQTGAFCIENPAGEWISPKEHPISKRKYPQAFYPTEVWFISTFSDIKTAIPELQPLDREIDTALAASLRDGAC